MSNKIDVLVSTVAINGMIVNRKDTVSDYKDYYKLIDCNTFDVVRVTWKGQEISIFVDDEGLLKCGTLGRDVKHDNGTIELFGNLVVTGGTDDEGETLSIPKEITLLNLVEFISDAKYQVR